MMKQYRYREHRQTKVHVLKRSMFQQINQIVSASRVKLKHITLANLQKAISNQTTSEFQRVQPQSDGRIMRKQTSVTSRHVPCQRRHCQTGQFRGQVGI